MSAKAPISPDTHDQFWRTLVGPMLGEGVHREVYEMVGTEDWVVKVETSAGSFANVIEWETWESVKEFPQYAKWFAPCQAISPNGAILIQRRTARPTQKQLPRLMPTFLCDFKVENFGMLGRQIVSHDYGLFHAAHAGMGVNGYRMIKANWW